MATTTITPNMNLPVPVPSEQTGPAWAGNLQSDMYAIDSHDHTDGKGVAITPDGLNINADLPMNDNNVTEVKTVRFESQAAALAGASDVGCIYEVGDDLYYNDGAGNQVRITQGGNVSGAAGTITGLPSGTASASYAGATFTFRSATSTPAAMSVGPVEIGRQASGTKTVTVAPNNSQAADYDLTLPAALPASTEIVSLDSSGNLASVATTGTGSVVLASSPSISGGTISSPTISSPAISGATITTSTVKVTDGAAGAPSIAFSNDTDTGIYRVGNNTIGVTAGGVQVTNLDANGVQVLGGTASLPTHSFLNDIDTGMYRDGANALALSTNGTKRLLVDTVGVYANDMGIATTEDSTQLIKWRILTGTFTNVVSGDNFITSSFASCTPISVSGVFSSTPATGSIWRVIAQLYNATSTFYFDNLFSTITSISCVNGFLGTQSSGSYRIILYYQ